MRSLTQTFWVRTFMENRNKCKFLINILSWCQWVPNCALEISLHFVFRTELVSISKALNLTASITSLLISFHNTGVSLQCQPHFSNVPIIAASATGASLLNFVFRSYIWIHFSVNLAFFALLWLVSLTSDCLCFLIVTSHLSVGTDTNSWPGFALSTSSMQADLAFHFIFWRVLVAAFHWKILNVRDFWI